LKQQHKKKISVITKVPQTYKSSIETNIKRIKEKSKYLKVKILKYVSEKRKKQNNSENLKKELYI
jgi:phosphopantetheine adenylyltransferase